MTESDFVKSLISAHGIYEKLGLSTGIQVPASLPPNKEFNKISFDKSSDYCDIYFCGLKNNYLNFILNDLTYFQFSRTNETEVRYAFYPSPFDELEIANIKKFTDLKEKQLIDDETFSALIEKMNNNNKRPLIRYEYSASQYKKIKHPTSHLHIGHYGEDRWCVERFLTPYAFALQIAKMYFSDLWEIFTESDDPTQRKNECDSELVNARNNCAITPATNFHSDERAHFYFA